MDADEWGIVHTYRDAMGTEHTTSPELSATIRANMGEVSSLTREDGPPVLVVVQGRPTSMPGNFQLTLEDGAQISGRDDLPTNLPLGYHHLETTARRRPLRLIVAPVQCYFPESVHVWGWATQLYGVRSAASWGIGDFADLRRFAHWSAQIGAGVLVVNPLGAGAPTPRQDPSPYYPTSRLYRNLIYLRIEELPGASELADALQPLASAALALNADRQIHRDQIYELKRQALEKLWSRFAGDPAFDRYCSEQGAPLRRFSAYCALAERFGCDWRRWPDEYRRPDAQGTRRLAEDSPAELRFHAWVQWLLDVQLSQASRDLPIMQDLPIGSDPAGADAWAWQDLLACHISIGAPPDMYNTQGQCWGLPPFIPHKLKDAAYEPFIDTIRACLRHSGGLRIDHILGFFRLFWIPDGVPANEGAYVRYPADDLLRILALESVRAQAVIVGEDLGTVEADVRLRLADYRLLSYRLLYFEPEPPCHWPYLSLGAITTHDLPTIAGLWNGSDLVEQRTLGLSPSEDGMQAIRQQLTRLANTDDSASLDDVIIGAHRALDAAPSAIVTTSLEDAAAVAQRPNMPGTTRADRPNWSLALPITLEELEHSPRAHAIAEALNHHRANTPPR